MDRPQLIRRLRITRSVFFAGVAATLCMLWARSYWWREQAVWVFAPGRYIDVQTDRGNLSSRFRDKGGQVRLPADAPKTFIFRSRWLSTSDRTQGFGWHVSRDFVFIASPYWFLVLTAATANMLTALWRPRWHFSLRTLLIATTLVAVVLGLGVWAAS
jgi:hypothetical protein